MEKNTPEQNKIFQQFKEKIRDHLEPGYYRHEDDYLRKWLVARDWKIEDATTMFMNNVEFRKTRKTDTILQWYKPNPIVQKYMPLGVLGFDKEDCVILIESFGLLDMKGLMHAVKESDIETFRLHHAEEVNAKLHERSKQTGKLCDGMTFITDMKSISASALWAPGFKFFMHCSQLIEDNYPDMLRRLIIINAPKIFPVLYKLGSAKMSPEMKKKIFVSVDGNVEFLRNIIADENLPKYLGGQMVDSNNDPRCSEYIGQGGKVPEELLKCELQSDHFTKVTIEARDSVEIPLVIDQPNTFIRWEFRSFNHDIGFGIKFQAKNNSELVTLKEITRVNCHRFPDDGSIECEQTGIYIIVFDNSFSVMRGKELEYAIDVYQENDLYKKEVGVDHFTSM